VLSFITSDGTLITGLIQLPPFVKEPESVVMELIRAAHVEGPTARMMNVPQMWQTEDY